MQTHLSLFQYTSITMEAQARLTHFANVLSSRFNILLSNTKEAKLYLYLSPMITGMLELVKAGIKANLSGTRICSPANCLD